MARMVAAHMPDARAAAIRAAVKQRRPNALRREALSVSLGRRQSSGDCTRVSRANDGNCFRLRVCCSDFGHASWIIVSLVGAKFAGISGAFPVDGRSRPAPKRDRQPVGFVSRIVFAPASIWFETGRPLSWFPVGPKELGGLILCACERADGRTSGWAAAAAFGGVRASLDARALHGDDNESSRPARPLSPPVHDRAKGERALGRAFSSTTARRKQERQTRALHNRAPYKSFVKSLRSLGRRSALSARCVGRQREQSWCTAAAGSM